MAILKIIVCETYTYAGRQNSGYVTLVHSVMHDVIEDFPMVLRSSLVLSRTESIN